MYLYYVPHRKHNKTLGAGTGKGHLVRPWLPPRYKDTARATEARVSAPHTSLCKRGRVPAQLNPTLNIPFPRGSFSLSRAQGPIRDRGLEGIDPFSLDWLGLAVCPVGARFSGAAIGWHESPSLPSGDAHRRRGGVSEHPSFPRGGHNKAEDWVVENQRPLPRDLTLACCSYAVIIVSLVGQRLENAVRKIRNFVELDGTYEIT